MEVTILAVGKLKERYLVDGIKEYALRISKYSKIKIIEVADEKAPEKSSNKDIEIIKNKEGLRLLNRLPKDAYIITLVIKGRKLTSEELSKKIDDIKLYHSSKIVFVIGGSNGLSDDVISKSKEVCVLITKSACKYFSSWGSIQTICVPEAVDNVT